MIDKRKLSQLHINFMIVTLGEITEGSDYMKLLNQPNVQDVNALEEV